jgi:hypothetical protein
MREEVEKILKVLPENVDLAGAIDFMLDKKLISSTAPRDAEIIYRLRENIRDAGTWRGKIRTACQIGVSDRTVYRVADRFEES